ncbi:MAG: hypothetical protein MUP03_09620 [Anaerolineales bacterium]|nr:hypothetical protein [Anaerolineales bacterium]
MADIIATPLAQGLPGYISLNPWFDQPAPIVGILGIPWWFLICCFFLLILVLVNLSWVFKIKRMGAVKGYKEIQKKAGPDDIMVWLFGKTQKMMIECLRYVDSVASYNLPTRISKWHLTSPMAMAHIGGYPAMIVSDDFDQSRDPVSEVALCYACDLFNAELETWVKDIMPKLTLPEDIDYKALAQPIDNYNDYSDRGHLLLKLAYPDGIPIPSYNIFNPTRFRKYFPKGRSAGFFGGVQLRKARELKAQVVEKGFWEKALPMMMILAIIIVVVMAAWMAPLGK